MSETTPRADSHTADAWIAKQVALSGGDAGAALSAFAKKPDVDVLVQFCGDCGYAPRFEELAGELRKQFANEGGKGWLNITGRKDIGATSRFEVYVNNVLVHSKIERGMGFVDTEDKKMVIVDAIRAAHKATDDAVVPVAGAAYGTMNLGGEGDDDEEEGMDEETERKTLVISICTLLLSIPALIGACCWPALVVGLVSGTVSGFARSLGHYISFGITATLMIVVNVFIARGIKFRWGSCCQKYGPFILSMIAAPLICADLLRHVLNDTNVWPWCGDPSQQRGLFPRVNTSWTADCLFSSTQFICTIPCCVPGNNAAPPGWTGPEQDGMLPPYWPEYDQLNSSELARIGKETVAGGTLGQPDCNCLNCVPLEDENIWNLSPIGILFTIIFTYSGFTLLAISTMWNANILKKCGEMKEQWKKLRGMGKKKKGGLKQSIQQPLIGEGV